MKQQINKHDADNTTIVQNKIRKPESTGHLYNNLPWKPMNHLYNTNFIHFGSKHKLLKYTTYPSEVINSPIKVTLEECSPIRISFRHHACYKETICLHNWVCFCPNFQLRMIYNHVKLSTWGLKNPSDEFWFVLKMNDTELCTLVVWQVVKSPTHSIHLNLTTIT